MAATISSSGTWSTIPTDERPVVHRDTVEERYGYESMISEDDLKSNLGGFPELEQFLGLMADAYDIPAIGALVRLGRMIDIMQNRTRATSERSYTP